MNQTYYFKNNRTLPTFTCEYKTSDSLQVGFHPTGNRGLRSLSALYESPKSIPVSITEIMDTKPKEASSPGVYHLNELTTSTMGSLFSIAQIVNNLNKKIICYQKYGLTSSLGTCSENHLSRQTYIGASPSSLYELGGGSGTKDLIGDINYNTLQLSSHLLIIT